MIGKVKVTTKNPPCPDCGGMAGYHAKACPAMSEIYFFSNGNTIVLRGGEQVPELQHPWVGMVAKFLEEHGEDPASFVLYMPDGHAARFFRTEDPEDRWSWRFL
jgi:hypothetical protein